MYTVPLFAGWRPRWDASPELRLLGREADASAQRRNAGYHCLPSFVMDEQMRKCLNMLWAAYRSWSGDSTRLRGYQAIGMLLARLAPLIEAARWSRWIHLERALDVSANAGDLVGSALLLRTMIGDLTVLQRLDILREAVEDDLQDLEAREVVDTAEGERLREYVGLLISYVLPKVPELSGFELPTTPPRRADLHDVYSQLNDYVHPNYGSFVASVLPESSVSGALLLTSVRAVYDAFFELSWSAAPMPEGATAEAYPPVHDLAELDDFFTRRSVAFVSASDDAALCDARGEKIAAIRESLAWDRPVSAESDGILQTAQRAQSFREDFESAEQTLRRLLGHAGGIDQWLCTLVEVCDSLDPDSTAHGDGWEKSLRFPLDHPGLGLPVTYAGWHHFVATRRALNDMEVLVHGVRPEQLFPDSPPYGIWFDFIVQALGLSVMVNDHKVNTLTLGTIRMLNRRNPLGAVVLGRAILEHYAEAHWLGRRLNKWQDEFATTVHSNGMAEIRARFSALESEVAQFLAGTKASQEVATGFRERWRSMAGVIGIRKMVEALFPDDPFHYGIYSAVVHGTALTGGDLLLSDDYARAVEDSTILVLAARGEADRVTGNPVAVIDRLRTLMRAIGTATSDRQVRNALRAITLRRRELLEGRDYAGDGTPDVPFRFDPRLNYHESCTRLLRDLGHEPRSFHAWISPPYFGTRVETMGGDTLYFVMAPEQNQIEMPMPGLLASASQRE